MSVLFGIDCLVANPEIYRGKRIGLVTNDAATTVQLVPTRQAMVQAGLNVTLLFSPEHGLQTIGADGHAMPHGVDVLTGLQIYSLYGDALAPSLDVLREIDVLFVDLPDIGSRFYTYIWTLSYVLEACALAGTPLVVLDRPNPLSGNLMLAEGPMLDETALSSFIGRWRLPVRHSLTMGELATYWIKSRLPVVELHVVPASGWQRQQFFHELTIPFVPTSPAITTVDTTLLYPALCFLEGTNLAEGRGTAYPFRICGAPWVNGYELADEFNALALPGCRARAITFTPCEGKFANIACQGIMVHLTSYCEFRPIRSGLSLIWLLSRLYPDTFGWNPYPTLVNATGANHFDLLTGDGYVRTLLEQEPGLFLKSLDNLTSATSWQQDRQVQSSLLY